MKNSIVILSFEYFKLYCRTGPGGSFSPHILYLSFATGVVTVDDIDLTCNLSEALSSFYSIFHKISDNSKFDPVQMIVLCCMTSN